MTVSSVTNKNTYAGDGSTTTFAYTFPILDETHILVQIKDTAGAFTTKVITTDYTVTGTGNATGNTNYVSGNVVFGAGDIPISTDTVVFTRNVPFTQVTDYVENDPFPANTHEEALDKLTMINQQQTEVLDRAIKLDSAISGFDGTIATPVADEFIQINSAGDGFVSNAGTSVIDNLSKADSTFYVGDGTTVVAETGGTARASMGVTIGTDVQAEISGATLTAATISASDKVLVQDADDSDNLKTVTTQAVADLFNIVTDTSPQLGGSLDVNGQSIVSVSAGDITLTPDTTGSVVIDGLSYPQADGTANQILETDGAGNLQFVTNSGGSGIADVIDDTTPQLGGSLDVNGQSIVSVSAGAITLTPDTTGDIILDGLKWPQADGTTGQLIKTDGAGQLSFVTGAGGGGDVVDDTTPQLGGNLDMNGKDITTLSNLDIDLAPNGTGSVNIIGSSTSAAEVRLGEDSDNGTNYMGIKAPAAVTASVTLTLPDGDGTSGQVLSTNGSGVLAWGAGGGKVLQAVTGSLTTQLSTSNNINVSTSIPQNTEGTEYMTLAITPTSATSELVITSVTNLSAGGAGDVSVALFQDSTANALGAAQERFAAANSVSSVVLNHTKVSGSTSATTFKLRYGAHSGTSYVNRKSGALTFGGAFTCTLTIYEIEV